jgi:hypothetical protein
MQIKVQGGSFGMKRGHSVLRELPRLKQFHVEGANSGIEARSYSA